MATEPADGTKNLKVCACKSVAYCGKDCQLADWKRHKKDCGGGEEGSLVKKSREKKGGKGEK